MKTPKLAGGLLLYRTGDSGLEVLLVHASGNYNRHKPWSIPKGETDPGETDLEATARRETWEETGVQYDGPVISLGKMSYSKSGKEISAYAGPAPADCSPRCASWEVDRAEFVTMETARSVLHPEQQVFLDRLIAAIGK